MIFLPLRLAASGAVHFTGGVAMGVAGALAACTVAQVAVRGMRETNSDHPLSRMSGLGRGSTSGLSEPTAPPPSPPGGR